MPQSVVTTRIARAGADGSPVDSLDIFTYNAGEPIGLIGTITVTDQDGNILCEQVLANVADTVGGNVCQSTFQEQAAAGGFVPFAGYATNPVQFVCGYATSFLVSITGHGCPQYAPGAVTATDTVSIASSTILNYPGVVYPPSYANSFFNFESPNGSPCRIVFGGITNTTSQVADYGFLQIVTFSSRTALLQDGSSGIIAQFDGSYLDDHDGVPISPIIEGVEPGQTFDLAFSDAPGFEIVRQWRRAGQPLNIINYIMQDNFTAYLMYRSRTAGSQWIAVASVEWSVAGTLAYVEGQRPPWAVQQGLTALQQPAQGNLAIFPPTWQGTAQSQVQAQIIDGCYQSISELETVPENTSVRYRKR